MSRKIQFRALIGLVAVVAIVVGVLVWPAPKEARALVLETAHFDWEGLGYVSDTEITKVVLTFLDAQQDVIAGAGGDLTYCYYDGFSSFWNGFFDIPEDAASVKMEAFTNTLQFEGNPSVEWVNLNGNTNTISVVGD